MLCGEPASLQLCPPTPSQKEARSAGVEQRQVRSPDPSGQDPEGVLNCRYTVTF